MTAREAEQIPADEGAAADHHYQQVTHNVSLTCRFLGIPAASSISG